MQILAKPNVPIGVFDSGMGGLTVLAALKKALPHESFIYLGDTARLPYGTKSRETVCQYAVQMARILVERGVKAMVIACNTASMAALSHLQTILPDVPVLGVISPGAKAAVLATRNKKIAVLATETTILSKAYQNLITTNLPDATVSGHICSILVALAEEGMIDNNIAKVTLEHYIAAFNSEDTILLGCTHFPVFKPLLEKMLPKEVKVVDSAETTAHTLQDILPRPTDNFLKTTGQIQYLVTDSIKRFQSVGVIFFGESLNYNDIELVNV